MNDTEYVYNFDDTDEIWTSEIYPTREEAIEAAKEENETDFAGDCEKVYIGKVVPFVPKVSADRILDTIEEDAWEEIGELGSEWSAYNYKKKDELKELEESLNKEIQNWMHKYGYYPNFYSVQDVEEISLKENG